MSTPKCSMSQKQKKCLLSQETLRLTKTLKSGYQLGFRMAMHPHVERFFCLNNDNCSAVDLQFAPLNYGRFFLSWVRLFHGDGFSVAIPVSKTVQSLALVENSLRFQFLFQHRLAKYDLSFKNIHYNFSALRNFTCQDLAGKFVEDLLL